VQPPELERNRRLVYWATAVLIILVIVMVILLFASRAT
jgi:heme/copper-type cytochrome/quinol oxidase subunit 2